MEDENNGSFCAIKPAHSMHVDGVLFQILLVGKALEALSAGEVLLALMCALHVILQLARDPEQFGAQAAAQLKHTARMK